MYWPGDVSDRSAVYGQEACDPKGGGIRLCASDRQIVGARYGKGVGWEGESTRCRKRGAQRRNTSTTTGTQVNILSRIVGREKVVSLVTARGKVIVDMESMRASGEPLDRETERHDIAFGISRIVAVEVTVLPTAGIGFIGTLVEIDA